MGYYKTFFSEISFWLDNPTRNWSGMGSVSNRFEAGFHAVSRLNRILENAPRDVGGPIAFRITPNRLDNLRIRRLILKTFVDSIHYEIAERVDMPFAKSLEHVMETVYDLKPENFRVRKDGLFASSGQSLKTLLLSITADEEIRKAFLEQIEMLEDSEPDYSMQVAIAEAKYWIAEFEKAEDIHLLAQDFIDKNERDWPSKTPEERKALLQEYAISAGEVMDNPKWYDFFGFHKPIVRAVAWISEDPNAGGSTTAYGYTYAQSRNGIVYLNDSFGTGDPAEFDMHKALNTVTHETRHQYQAAADVDTTRYNTPESLSEAWFNSKYKDYWKKPIEVDARAFAGLATI
jgi:hypothetical protein